MQRPLIHQLHASGGRDRFLQSAPAARGGQYSGNGPCGGSVEHAGQSIGIPGLVKRVEIKIPVFAAGCHQR